MDRTEVCSEQTTAVRWKVTVPRTLVFFTAFRKITRPLECAWCEIPRENWLLPCFRPVCVSVVCSAVLCEAAPDRAAPTPATGIWYSPCGRVGEPCGRGAQIPSNGEAQEGKRARNMSLNRPCEGFHLEGIKHVQL